jgi:hypothetical protein
MSTTKTETRSTTKSETSNVCHVEITAKGTKITRHANLQSILPTLSLSEFLRQNGIKQKNAVNSQKEITPHRLENPLPSKNSSVNFAARILKSIRLTILLNSVTSTASRRSKGRILGTGKNQIASFAERSLGDISIQTKKPKLAPAGVEGVYAVGQKEVFNLEVEDCPEYFAKGVLVHNCRNAIVMAYSSLITNAKPVQMGSWKGLSQIPQTTEYIDVDSIIVQSEADDMARR